MKPILHAQSSAAKFGGVPAEYLDIHNFMDSTKSANADVRHRAVFHSAFGIFIVERVFGPVRTNSDGRIYSVRDIAEQHVQEDLGFIPTLEQWLKHMTIEPWMMGRRGGKSKFIPMDGDETVTEDYIFTTKRDGAGTLVETLTPVDLAADGVRPVECKHDWKIWPETNGQTEKCMLCGEYQEVTHYNVDSFRKRGLYFD